MSYQFWTRKVFTRFLEFFWGVVFFIPVAILHENKCLNNFQTGPPKNHLSKVL